MARCWWYLASCLDDGFLARRNEEQADVLNESGMSEKGLIL